MRNFNSRIRAAFIILFGVIAFTATGQDTKIQIIHNIAAIDCDTVDVYVDNEKYNDVSFRSATALLTHTAGAHVIRINHKSSSDSSDQIKALLDIDLIANSIGVVMLTGVDVPANYAANPNGRSTAITAVYKSTLATNIGVNQTRLMLLGGSTDADLQGLSLRPNTTLIAGNVGFGDTSATADAGSVSTFIDVKQGASLFKSYVLPLEMYVRKNLTLFSSGFVDPAVNQNGAAYGVFVVDTNGGQAVALNEAVRLQVINNSPDVILDAVDVWLGEKRIITDLPFRNASSMLTTLSGTHEIIITKRNSDTSASNIITRLHQTFVTGKTYLIIATGVVDSTQYALNPDGAGTSYQLLISDQYSEYSGNATEMSLMTFQGSPDLPKVDITQTSPAPLKWADDIAFNNGLISLNVTAGNVVFTLTSADESENHGVFATSLGAGKTGVLLTSGFASLQNNPTDAKLMQVLLVGSDGSVQLLTPRSTQIQFIHNSADVTNDTIDIYMNGLLWKDNFHFRGITPFITVNALVDYVFAIAPKNSTNAADAFYTTTINFSSDTNYYLIANGVKDVANYEPNPSGKSIGFVLESYKGALSASQFSAKNVDLLYYHGVTDLPATTIKGTGQVQYLSKGETYGTFHDYYASHSAESEVEYRIRIAPDDSVVRTYYANLSAYSGSAALVFSSGFYIPDSNQNGHEFLLFAAFPDGNIDTIGGQVLNTGIKEQLRNTNNDVVCYPNPANDRIKVAFAAKHNSVAVISLVDITGKSVMEKQVHVISGMNEVTINLDFVKTGLYFMNFVEGETRITQKIQISR